jgi:hypothetical protein
MREAFHIAEEDLIQYAMGTLKEGQLSSTRLIFRCATCRGDLARIQVELGPLPRSSPNVGVARGRKR